MVDSSQHDRVGEFRGVVGPFWCLRPVAGGQEWKAEPQFVREADSGERMRALATRANARSRGELL
ncbi:hypothetical protein ACFY2H_39925 [Streptomyces griseofuscus]|uniref:hypothetical protein n=1 Tax=Streptomyces griseofuscus TaxID=146922 RepID=UPI00368678A3